MKKTILATLLAAASFGVLASEFGSVEYTPAVKNKTTGQIASDQTTVVVGTSALKFVTVDGKLDVTRNRGNGLLTNDAQVRGTIKMPIGQNLDVWGRGGVGRSFTTGNSYGFYTYAGGADLKLYDNVTAFASAERNNSFKAGNPHSTAYELGLGYSLTKKDTLSASYVRTLGDIDTGGVKVGYSRSF